LADGLLFDTVVALDARGFLLVGEFMRESYPIVMARKPNKLPSDDIISVDYKKEYGTDTITLNKTCIKPGSRVLVVDDLIATGGSMKAVEKLVNMCDSEVVGFVAPYAINTEDGLMASLDHRMRYLLTQDELEEKPIEDTLKHALLTPSSPALSTITDPVSIIPPSLQLLNASSTCQQVPVKWGSFKNSSNIWVDFNMVRDRDVKIYIDPSNPRETNDILQILSIIYRKKAKSITIVIPFLEQGTQDRIEYKGEYESIALVDTFAKLIGKHDSVTYDIHSEQTVFAYHNLRNVSIINELYERYKRDNAKHTVVFPDDGAAKRFGYLEKENYITFRKIRDGCKRIVSTDDNVLPTNYVIVDDLVRSGGTLNKVAQYLLDHGALSVDALFAHAPFEHGAGKNLSIFRAIYTSDSCPRNVPRHWVKAHIK
jgi:adenine phosphoribosyltransferase